MCESPTESSLPGMQLGAEVVVSVPARTCRFTRLSHSLRHLSFDLFGVQVQEEAKGGGHSSSPEDTAMH